MTLFPTTQVQTCFFRDKQAHSELIILARDFLSELSTFPMIPQTPLQARAYANTNIYLRGLPLVMQTYSAKVL